MRNAQHSIRHQRRSSRHLRRGATILEIMVACILIAATVSTAIPILSAIKLHRRSTIERQVACVEAENILEQLTSAPWDELTPDSVEKQQLSNWVQQRLPDAALSTSLQTNEDELPAKQITVRIAWKSSRNQEIDIELSAWVFQEADAA